MKLLKSFDWRKKKKTLINIIYNSTVKHFFSFGRFWLEHHFLSHASSFFMLKLFDGFWIFLSCLKTYRNVSPLFKYIMQFYIASVQNTVENTMNLLFCFIYYFSVYKIYFIRYISKTTAVIFSSVAYFIWLSDTQKKEKHAIQKQHTIVCRSAITIRMQTSSVLTIPIRPPNRHVS